LSRDVVLNNSDETTLSIDWGTGTRDVFLTMPAAQIVSLERLRPYTEGNVLINGDFRIAQRGSSAFTASGHTFDRWLLYTGGGSNVVSVSRTAFALGQTAVSGEPQYYVTMDRTGTGSGGDAFFSQKIEGVRTLAGQTCTVSYWAKASIPVTQGNFKVLTVQDFGSGGMPSSNNSQSFDSPALSTAWQRFTSTISLSSISGKTLGSDSNDCLLLRFSLKNEAGSAAVSLANVKLEPGDIAGEYRPRPIGEELALCQRYYWKTFPYDVAPAQNAGPTGALATLAGSGGDFVFSIRYTTRMRSSPTITTFSPSENSAEPWNSDDAAAVEVSVSGPTSVGEVSDFGCIYRSGAVLSGDDAGNVIQVHVTADAEL